MKLYLWDWLFLTLCYFCYSIFGMTFGKKVRIIVMILISLQIHQHLEHLLSHQVQLHLLMHQLSFQLCLVKQMVEQTWLSVKVIVIGIQVSVP